MVPDEVMAARMKRWLADLRRKIAALEAHQMELAAIQERTPDVDNEKQLARGDEALRDAREKADALERFIAGGVYPIMIAGKPI
jgi:hypothetical protein